jgi:hypothetical protein
MVYQQGLDNLTSRPAIVDWLSYQQPVSGHCWAAVAFNLLYGQSLLNSDLLTQSSTIIHTNFIDHTWIFADFLSSTEAIYEHKSDSHKKLHLGE